MPTPSKGPRMGGSPAHERLILANLATSLFEHGRITTTETKAKRLRPHAEKLITIAKKGTLHSRREVMKTVRDKDVVHKLFAEIAPSFATRDGGYTRIVKTAPRKGDNAPMAIIELVVEETVSSAANRVARRAASTRSTTKAAAPAAQVTETNEATQAEQAVDEAPPEGAVDVADEVTADETAADETAADEAAADETAVVETTADETETAAVDAAESTEADVQGATQAEQAVDEAPAEGAVESGDAEVDEKK